jgi:hypothetical protein
MQTTDAQLQRLSLSVGVISNTFTEKLLCNVFTSGLTIKSQVQYKFPFHQAVLQLIPSFGFSYVMEVLKCGRSSCGTSQPWYLGDWQREKQ